MDERKQQRRQEILRVARANADGPRYFMNEADLAEKRLRQREREVHEAQLKHEQESEAVLAWLKNRNYEDNQTGRTVAAEPALSEPFDWRWVDRRISARLKQEREFFEQQMEELNAAFVDHAQTVNEVLDVVVRMVGDTLNKTASKSHKEFTDALEKVSQIMRENQHEVMRAINNRIGEHGKTINEPQSAPRGVH
jgi:hypothetical protein